MLGAQLNHLGTALHEAIELDAEMRNEIGKAAREKVLSAFSLEQEKIHLEALIQRLLSNSSYKSPSILPV